MAEYQDVMKFARLKPSLVEKINDFFVQNQAMLNSQQEIKLLMSMIAPSYQEKI